MTNVAETIQCLQCIILRNVCVNTLREMRNMKMCENETNGVNVNVSH
jgi:hypothetical protein